MGKMTTSYTDSYSITRLKCMISLLNIGFHGSMKKMNNFTYKNWLKPAVSHAVSPNRERFAITLFECVYQSPRVATLTTTIDKRTEEADQRKHKDGTSLKTNSTGITHTRRY